MDQKAFRGRLSFSVGETILSAWEAARLAPGDIVLTSRQAGYPGFLLFNNLPLGWGEVVVFDRSFGVRVVDGDFRPHFGVDPGRIDALGEMVPSVVELGGFEVGLEELNGLPPNSFINLGVAPLREANAVLRFAGLALARGTVVVVGEQMGLRICETLTRLPVPAQVRQSGNLADRVSAQMAKDYDFSRPDRWSRVQIQRLDEIHRLFQRNLEASIPEAARLLEGRTDALLVDQCTLGEARGILEGMGLASFRTWEHLGLRRGSRAESPRSRKLFFEPADSPLPLSASTRKFIEGFSEPQGLSGHRPVFLHSAPWVGEGEFRTLTDCLRNGWKKLLDFHLEAADPVQDLSDHEMVILILLRQNPGAPPALALVYPFLTLEPYMSVLGS